MNTVRQTQLVTAPVDAPGGKGGISEPAHREIDTQNQAGIAGVHIIAITLTVEPEG